jgi:hypothetical protein
MPHSKAAKPPIEQAKTLARKNSLGRHLAMVLYAQLGYSCVQAKQRRDIAL